MFFSLRRYFTLSILINFRYFYLILVWVEIIEVRMKRENESNYLRKILDNPPLSVGTETFYLT